MKTFIFILWFIPVIGKAQDTEGVHFESGLSWEQIKAKAKTENKFIFMDCYASWCGPCKYMTQTVFPQKEVGDFMNAHFINVEVQMDKSERDDYETKKWYNEADSLGKQYSIVAYPTYLYFSPDGENVHRFTGAHEAKSFIALSNDALNPEQQYRMLVEAYQIHLNDSSYLHRALKMALRVDDVKSAEKIANAYFLTLGGNYNSEEIYLLRKALFATDDSAFPLFIKNPDKLDSILNRPSSGYVKSRVVGVIANEEVVPLFANKLAVLYWEKIKKNIEKKFPAISPDILEGIYGVYEDEIITEGLRNPLYKTESTVTNWDSVARTLRERYPGYNPDSVIEIVKAQYFCYKKMWAESDQSALAFLNRYGPELAIADPRQLNDLLWDVVFMHSNNRLLLLKAIELSRAISPVTTDTTALRHFETFENMDTYANLLYKAGEKEKGILYEKTVLNAAQNFGLASKPGPGRAMITNFKITLEKMQKGESTWTGRNGHDEFQ